MRRVMIHIGDFDYDRVDCLIIPDDMDIEAEERALLSAYPPNHCPVSLADWLLLRGAKKAEDVEIILR